MFFLDYVCFYYIQGNNGLMYFLHIKVLWIVMRKLKLSSIKMIEIQEMYVFEYGNIKFFIFDDFQSYQNKKI